jgi:hypothetical protein
MEWIFVSIYAIGICACISKIKAFKFVVSAILLFFLWLILAGSNTVDLYNYQIMYNQAAAYTPIEVLTSWSGRDIGYAFFTSLFSYAYIDFDEFRIIFSTIYLFLLVFFIRKETNSLLLVLILYVLWSFFMDAIQIRTLIVHLMIFIAFLVYSRCTTKTTIIAISIVVVACTVHILAAFYLPVFLFHRFYKNKCILFFILLSSLSMPLYIDFLGGALSSIINNFLVSSSNNDISVFSRYQLNVSNYAKYIYWLFCNGMFFLITYIRNKYNNEDNIEENKRNYFEICYAVCLYLLIFMPLYGLSGGEVGRFFRCFTLLFIVAIVIYIQTVKSNLLKILITSLAAIFLFLEGWVGLYYSAWDKVLQLFNENIIWNTFFL